MIHFQHPSILWFLLLVPLCVGAWIWLQYRNRKRLEDFADSGMFGRLIPDASKWRPATKFGLIMLAAAFLIIALANPQEGSKMVKGERLGSDVAICLDISNSMMAEDIQPNRLERSKRTVANLLNALGSDRISLVVFAGSSYVQMPLTSDYSAVKLFLDQIDCSLISAQGTAIGDAIDKAMETFGYGDPDREWVKNQGRAIVVISDGENFEDDAEAAARKAAAQNVRVCTIGMGLTEGTPIPEYRGGQRVGYKRDNNGNTVTTHLDEATLTAIAHAGKGIYVRANNINSGIQDIVKLIEGLEKDKFGEAIFSEYESRYYFPLAAALLCLIAELLIFERRNKKFNLDKLMKRGLPILFLLVMTLSSYMVEAQSAQTRKDTRKGNREYRSNHFDRAEVDYRRALHHDSTAYRAHYNLGNTLYRQKKYEEAAQHYSRALEHPDLDKKTRSRILHNRGNSNLKAGLQKENRAEGMDQFQKAVNDYQEALKINPKNDDTRYNLSYAKKLLQQAQQQQQQNGGGQNNQDQKDNKDKNKDGNNGQDNQQDQNQQSQQNNNQNQQQQKQNRQQQKQQQQRQEQKKQDAERLLEAVKNNEKNTMKENAKKLEVAPAGRIEKDW